MNSMYSQDWNTWLPAANVAFARILQAKDVKNYKPSNRDFTDLCMFPLEDDDAAVKTLVSSFCNSTTFVVTYLTIFSEATFSRERPFQHCTAGHG